MSHSVLDRRFHHKRTWRSVSVLLPPAKSLQSKVQRPPVSMTSRASPVSPAVTMATAMPLQRQQSFQSSILFMQQEHATTLKGLHTEIQKLQKRCSDLTFQVAMGTASSPQEDFYREKAEKLEKEFEEKTTALTEAAASLEKKEKRVITLDQQLRAQEKRYHDNLKAKDQQLKQLKAELSEKAALNAELMLQRLSQSQEGAAVFRLTTSSSLNDEEVRISNREGITRVAPPAPVPPIKIPITPHPPKDGTAVRIRRRTSPRAIRVEGEPKLCTKVKPRAASGRALYASRPDTPDEVPDPTPFLKLHQEDHPEVMCKKPLPPIGARAGKHFEVDCIPPRQTTSDAFVAKKKTMHKKHNAHHVEESSEASSPEVEVLTMDTVIKRDHKLRHAHEYKRTDCN